MAVSADNGGGHGERVEDGFFGGFDWGGDQGIEMGVGEMSQCIGGVFGIMRNVLAVEKASMKSPLP